MEPAVAGAPSLRPFTGERAVSTGGDSGERRSRKPATVVALVVALFVVGLTVSGAFADVGPLSGLSTTSTDASATSFDTTGASTADTAVAPADTTTATNPAISDPAADTTTTGAPSSDCAATGNETIGADLQAGTLTVSGTGFA